MLEEGEMFTNGNLFQEKLEVPRSGVDRAYQGRVIKQIILGCSEQSKENQRRTE